MRHAEKRVYSAAFVIAFLAFVTIDIFYGWTVQSLHWSPIAVRVVEGLSLLAALVLFVMLMTRLPPSESVTEPRRDPLVKHLKDTNDPLLVLRLFAFLCVIVTHCFIIFRPEISEASWEFLLKGCAHSAMVIFFCLSGYLMGKAFYRGRYTTDTAGLRAFYLNRVLRIIPLVYLTSAIVIAFSRHDLLKTGIWAELWRPLLFLYYDVNQPGPISALWAVSVEMQYYVIAPFVFILLAPLLSSRVRAYVFVGGVIVSDALLKYGLYQMGTDWTIHRYIPLLANLPFFLVGFGINPLIEQGTYSNIGKKNIVVAAFLCFIIYLVGSAGEYSYLRYFVYGHGRLLSYKIYYQTLIEIVMIMTFFCILSTERYKIGRKYFGARSPRWSLAFQIGGLLTFGLYVWHEPVLLFFAKRLPQVHSLPEYGLYCGCGFLLVLFFALATYLAIERPLEKFKA